MRTLLLAILLFVTLAPAALADEIFVLANEYTVRGRVVRETKETLVVRLTGLRERNTITLRRDEIVRRYLQKDYRAAVPTRTSDADAPLPHGPVTALGQPRTIRVDDGERVPESNTPALDVDSGTLPTTEPGMRREGFFERLERVTRMGFPAALEGRLLVLLLLLIALSVIVAGGARLLGMKAPALHASTTLGILLGVFLLSDILMHGELLRADRAIWVLPVQAAVWLAAARALLEAPATKTIPLLAMVLFASTCFVFLTGSVLVTF